MDKLLTDPLGAIKQFNIPVWVVLRWLAVIGIMWNYSGDYIKSYAGQVLKEQLNGMGLSPELFAQLQSKMTEIDKQTDGNTAGLTRVEIDIKSLLFSLKQAEENGKDTKAQVDRIVNYLINKKTDNP